MLPVVVFAKIVVHAWFAAAAEDAGLVVLHNDANFDRIAAVTGQKCEWVVAPGSIDELAAVSVRSR